MQLAAAKGPDTSSFIDAPYMEIGRLAALYGRRNGYVICDDLLQDDRKVSVVMNYDDPYQVESILAAYGYRSYQDRGLTYWCGSSDPFGGASLQLVPGRNAEGPIVDLSYNGSRYRYLLSTLASYNDLIVAFENCAYQLKRRNGRVVRYLTDQQCLADLALHPDAAGARPSEVLQTAAEQPQVGSRVVDQSRPVDGREAASTEVSHVSYGGPATADRAISAAANTGPPLPAFHAK